MNKNMKKEGAVSFIFLPNPKSSHFVKVTSFFKQKFDQMLFLLIQVSFLSEGNRGLILLFDFGRIFIV